MTHPTHKQYAISYAYIAAIIMYYYNMTEINYYLALPIIILVSKYGGLFPDIDHNWSSVKEKTIPNIIINKLIHMTGGKHRSWQTHSIDILCAVAVASYLVPNLLLEHGLISVINKEILGILMISFTAGWTSHLIADMMTSAGVRLFCWNKKLTIRLVPKNIGKLRFNTGNEWEAFVYKSTKTVNIILGIICLVFPIFVKYDIINSLIKLISGGR